MISADLCIAVQMDPLESIDPRVDTTFALLLEAYRRGYALFHYLPSSLAMRDGIVSARGQLIDLRDDSSHPFSIGPSEWRELRSMDVILLRQDPPFDMSYITSTYLLEYVGAGPLIVNDPVATRNAPEKLLIADCPDLFPPTLITREREAIRSFHDAYGDIVIKPLYEAGGRGVLRVGSSKDDLFALLDLFERVYQTAFVVQKYLPNVSKGDKRIILIDGVLAGLFNRVPPDGGFRANLSAGGRVELATPSARDLEICRRLGAILEKRGLILAGIDVIGDFVTEVNVTSPSGVRVLASLGGPDLAPVIWNAIEKRLRDRTGRA